MGSGPDVVNVVARQCKDMVYSAHAVEQGARQEGRTTCYALISFAMWAASKLRC